jgi:cytochrome o ubiquinol oxidase subunit 3
MSRALTTVSSINKAAESVRRGSSSLGFWIYLMTDCILFASLFATYVVLRDSTFGGPSGKDIFDMPFVLIETTILLTSSFVCGLIILAMHLNRKKLVLIGLGVTFLLGVAFLAMELGEFAHLVGEGYDWKLSAFLSAFFTLVGTHGLHIAVGLLWILVIGWQIFRRGFTKGTVRRLILFSLFWHFLDIVWIFIFTVVYLMGVA